MGARKLFFFFPHAGPGRGGAAPSGPDPPIYTSGLKPTPAFSAIQDERHRSVALFTEAARVIESPRCMNCHPVSRQPTQGDDLHPPVPFIRAAPHDHAPPTFPRNPSPGNPTVP